MEKIVAPRGTADVVPPESARWATLEAEMRATARRFGYGEIRTPMFESTELFTRGVGETTDIVEKEMYTFEDKGGRSLSLRPEWTAPVVRALLEKGLLGQGAQRLFYIGPIFRYEKPQRGRFRQAHQFGVECFGFEGPEADVEVIALAHDLLRRHGIRDAVVRINTIGDEESRRAYRDLLLAYFRPHTARLSADSQRRLERNPLRILDSKAEEDQALIADAPVFADSLNAVSRNHFSRVLELLAALGIEVQRDAKLVRGLDYYTHTVFEITSTRLGAQSAVCGGGRYDDLVATLGGPPTPGVGFGLGIERFLDLLSTAGDAPADDRDGIAAIAIGSDARTALMPLVADLRRVGDLRVSMDYDDARLKAQLKRADRQRARLALIVGDDELARGVVIARDLEARTQIEVPLTAEPHGAGVAAARVLALYAELAPAGAMAVTA